MRIAYIQGQSTYQLPKVKKKTDREQFMDDVHETLANRARLDLSAAEKLLATEIMELEQKTKELEKLKLTRNQL